ncbi:MAG: lysophospholipid acyltransferase family protein [Chloroflexota bacterium]|nr:lysophospholipid acyltransferase family protein [Chloroflexota bacterium]
MTSLRDRARGTISPFFSSLARYGLLAFGWKLVGEPPDVPRYVLLAAPHTSNWDTLIMLAVAYAFGIRLTWLGKDTVFRGPLGSVLRRLGGIPIDRGSRHNVVQQMVQAFEQRKRLVLALSPEGTRKRSAGWKSGFYYIALGAEVPIVLAFIDYKRKRAGVGPVLLPSGDIEADMAIIRKFYTGVTPKYPDKFGDIQIAGSRDVS